MPWTGFSERAFVFCFVHTTETHEMDTRYSEASAAGMRMSSLHGCIHGGF